MASEGGRGDLGRKKRIEDSELLAVARVAFVSGGFGASTREIARRAGVSEAILFQRFGTKADLFFAAMVPPGPDVHSILVAATEARDPSALFEEIAVGVLAYFREVTPVLLPLISHPSFSYEDFIKRYPGSPLNQLVVALQSWLTALEGEGRLLPGEAGPAAIGIVSSMASLALFEQIGVHGGAMDEALVRQVARLIWRGAAPAFPG